MKNQPQIRLRLHQKGHLRRLMSYLKVQRKYLCRGQMKVALTRNAR